MDDSKTQTLSSVVLLFVFLKKATGLLKASAPVSTCKGVLSPSSSVVPTILSCLFDLL